MKSRCQSLDVLRGTAVLLVIAHHAEIWPFARFGWVGVDLFFVLSGFLISNLLFREQFATGTIGLKRFWLRRGLKIWPAFYCFWLVSLVFTFHYFPLRPYALIASFTSNYIYDGLPSVFTAVWSLCVEEHFYFCLPLLLIFLVRSKLLKLLPLVCLSLMALAVALRIGVPADPSVFNTRASHLRMDSLLAGVLLSYLYNFKPGCFLRLSSKYAPLGLLLCVPELMLPQSNHWIQSFGLSGLYIGFGLLLAWAVPRCPRGRWASIVARIGVFSYSIYLWHAFVVALAPLLWQPLRKGFCVLISLAIGYLMAQAVEFPILRIRDRFCPRINPKAAPAVQPSPDDSHALQAESELMVG